MTTLQSCPDEEATLRQQQRRLLVLLTVGYAGYYLCRSNLSIASPLIVQEYSDFGITKEQIGFIAFFGTIIYTVGKLVNGILADTFGGKFLFLLGMCGCVAATIAFGLAGGLSAFAVLWGVNRFFGSMGWAALMQLTSRWYAPAAMATVMGILSISYLGGDALARLILGTLIGELGLGWRGMYFAAAAMLGVLAIFCLIFIRSSPCEVGCVEPPQSPLALIADGDKPPLRARLGALVVSRAFWLICALSLGLTIIRETFNFWSPTYFTEVIGLTPAAAARASAMVPLIGAVSAVLMGVVSDRFAHRPGLTLLPPMLALIGLILLLSYLDLRGKPTTAVLIICSIQFFLIAPYTLCGGYYAINLGGKYAAATAAGLIDAAGYFGAALADWTIGVLAERLGWSFAFRTLAAVVAVTTLAGFWYAQHVTYLRRQRLAAQSQFQATDPSKLTAADPSKLTAANSAEPTAAATPPRPVT